MRRRTKVLIAVVVVAPVLAATIASLVETDEEAIERLTDECRTAFLRGDAEEITSHLTADAECDGIAGRGPLARRVRFWVSQAKGRLEDVSLSLRKIVVEGDGARAEWVAGILAKPGGLVRRSRILVRLEYRREPNGWRIARASAGGFVP